MAEPKHKPGAALRIPKPKKKLGLVVPPALRLPHDDLIVAEGAPQQSSPDSQPSQTSLTTLTSPTNPYEDDIAPKRDFSKVANSITRQAVPDGIFTGKSKQLYDCLYVMTRGAVVPSRTVRISRPKLMKKSGIGSRITIEANIERLISVGLIQVRQIAGEHEGNEYTVYLPEEISTTMPSQTSPSSPTRLTRPAQKVDRLVSLETSQTRHTSSLLESTLSDNVKTSFKTDDDETHTLENFVGAIVEAVRCVVGGNLVTSEQERERWKELGELLASELVNASKHTDRISSVPAFFTTHLRRQLSRKAEVAAKPKIIANTKNSGFQSSAEKLIDNPKAKQSRPKRQTSAEAKSKFSLDECRRYAEHLSATGQGITNPGGFAMTIYRSGGADELIANFLQPKTITAKIDHKNCPRCYGTGMEVVEGKGARRCTYNWEAVEEMATRQTTTESIE